MLRISMSTYEDFFLNIYNKTRMNIAILIGNE